MMKKKEKELITIIIGIIDNWSNYLEVLELLVKRVRNLRATVINGFYFAPYLNSKM